jgi:hypothetical protein
VPLGLLELATLQRGVPKKCRTAICHAGHSSKLQVQSGIVPVKNADPITHTTIITGQQQATENLSPLSRLRLELIGLSELTKCFSRIALTGLDTICQVAKNRK